MSSTPRWTRAWAFAPSRRCAFWAKTWCCSKTRKASLGCWTATVRTEGPICRLVATRAMGCVAHFTAGSLMCRASAYKHPPSPQAASCANTSSNATTRWWSAAAFCLVGSAPKTARPRPFQRWTASLPPAPIPLRSKACGNAIGCKRLRWGWTPRMPRSCTGFSRTSRWTTPTASSSAAQVRATSTASAGP